jgi:hypothetical protein
MAVELHWIEMYSEKCSNVHNNITEKGGRP